MAEPGNPRRRRGTSSLRQVHRAYGAVSYDPSRSSEGVRRAWERYSGGGFARVTPGTKSKVIYSADGTPQYRETYYDDGTIKSRTMFSTGVTTNYPRGKPITPKQVEAIQEVKVEQSAALAEAERQKALVERFKAYEQMGSRIWVGTPEEFRQAASLARPEREGWTDPSGQYRTISRTQPAYAGLSLETVVRQTQSRSGTRAALEVGQAAYPQVTRLYDRPKPEFKEGLVNKPPIILREDRDVPKRNVVVSPRDYFGYTLVSAGAGRYPGIDTRTKKEIVTEEGFLRGNLYNIQRQLEKIQEKPKEDRTFKDYSFYFAGKTVEPIFSLGIIAQEGYARRKDIPTYLTERMSSPEEQLKFAKEVSTLPRNILITERKISEVTAKLPGRWYRAFKAEPTLTTLSVGGFLLSGYATGETTRLLYRGGKAVAKGVIKYAPEVFDEFTYTLGRLAKDKRGSLDLTVGRGSRSKKVQVVQTVSPTEERLIEIEIGELEGKRGLGKLRVGGRREVTFDVIIDEPSPTAKLALENLRNKNRLFKPDQFEPQGGWIQTTRQEATMQTQQVYNPWTQTERPIIPTQKPKAPRTVRKVIVEEPTQLPDFKVLSDVSSGQDVFVGTATGTSLAQSKSYQPTSFIDIGVSQNPFVTPTTSGSQINFPIISPSVGIGSASSLVSFPFIGSGTKIGLKSSPSLTNLLKQEQIQEQETSQEKIQRPRDKTGLKPLTIPILSLSTKQDTLLSVRPEEQLETQQITENILTTPPRPPRSPGLGKPKIRIPTFFPNIERKTKKRTTKQVSDKIQAYKVLVKRKQEKISKGKYKSRGYEQANTAPLSRQAALGLGMKTVDKYSNRSFKIAKTSGQPRPRSDLTSAYQRLKFKFRTAKRNANIRVERSTFAIDSYEEKQGIPYEAIKQRGRTTMRKKRRTTRRKTRKKKKR